METTSKKNTTDSFLKIDTIWSETNENFDSIAVKEEIVSDVEPELIESLGNNDSDDSDDCDNSFNQLNPEFGSNNKINSEINRFCRGFKRAKNSYVNSGTRKADLANDAKSTCLHDTKDFKVINRRLRCGNCWSLVCPECFKVMFSTLHNHFLGFDTNNSINIYSCKFCCFPFQSLCALQAHLRIHTLESPYVCPDCGLLYSSACFLIWHLINKCFHVYKVVNYKCEGCPGLWFTYEALLQHIQDEHLSVIFRCSCCSLLFNDSEDFKSHVDVSHQKQKVQSINYFRCNLCSDSVIPSFMYERHVNGHRENSESYNTQYQCICGEISNLVGAFRTHIQFCDKRGIMPPHWSFLKKKLKTQEILPMENSQERDDSSNQSDSHFWKSSACNDAQNHGGQSSVQNINEDNKVDESKQSSFSRISNGTALDVREDSVEICNNDPSENNKSNDDGEDGTDNKISTSDVTKGDDGDLKAEEKLSDNDIEDESEEGKTKNSEGAKESEQGEGQSTTAKERSGDGVESKGAGENSGEGKKDEKELKEKDCDSSKGCYDHIPCDHLGYVKTQGPESNQEFHAPNDENDPSDAGNRYRLVTELDDKTGLIVTRNVPNENVEENYVNGIPSSYEEVEVEASRTDDWSGTYPSNEKARVKGGSVFFTCPFCTVMFPKNSSAFQQFKLHVEYYHSDAALNITINNSENDVCAENERISGRNNNVESGCGKRISTKSGAAKGGSNSNKKAARRKKSRSVEMSAVNMESDKGKILRRMSHEVAVDKTPQKNKSRLFDEAEKENRTKDANKISRRSTGGRDVFWTVKLSVKNEDDENEDKDEDEDEETKNSTEDSNKNENSGANEAAENREKNESSKNQHRFKRVAIMRKVNCHNTKKMKFATKQIDGFENDSKTSDNPDDCGKFSSEKSIKNSPKSDEYENENKDLVKTENVDKMSEYENGENKRDIESEFEDDWENSKDSYWSNVSDIDLIASKDSADGSGAKPKAIGKIRRESEVWSELYESLQLAEKLKKSKKKKLESEETKGKASGLPDYSAKRVVKKPKRYRESSESECAFYENENSNDSVSDLFGGIDGAEDSILFEEDNLQMGKKQRLLDKLQNVDQKFMDYLFDLIERKEKCLELYRKHSSLRTSGYGMDLKTYRKKVLNGIKLRGRPNKILRYQDVARKKDHLAAIKPENMKETGCQRTPKKNGDIQDGKSSEKRRGRPRKIMEPSKLKERRRSDKEVDFIEKNFERDENGCSPSKRKRKLSSKLQYYKKINLSEEKDDFSSGQVITNKAADSAKKLCCAMCKDVFQEFNEFREHIVSHRQEENTYQCMECGECFVVRPSLEKHLHAFHKIKNTDKYIVENQCCNPKKEIPEPENEPLKENQCKVCKDQFERAIDLTKHFRIHGMAFLKEFKKEGKAKSS